jgi:hypothetical protein
MPTTTLETVAINAPNNVAAFVTDSSVPVSKLDKHPIL